jgi:hypothetical protein
LTLLDVRNLPGDSGRGSPATTARSGSERHAVASGREAGLVELLDS